MSEPRILIVANQLLVRAGLATLLASQPEVDVVGQVAGDDSETLHKDIDVYRPDVILYDLGYEPLALLPSVAPSIDAGLPVVALLADDAFISATLTTLSELDAYGALLREADAAMLSWALVAVANGLVALDPALALRLIPASDVTLPTPPADSLTPRESEVLQLIAQGLANRAIAQKLGISPNTVKFHINAILSKLDAQSRTEAVVRATQLGLIVL
jgi:DNA-binding NarL/FixJ family response regulator